MVNAGTDATAGGTVLSLLSVSGATTGLGEKFSPDVVTGTGNFSVPIAGPPGRLGLEPGLALSYSTGNGNRQFGLVWALSLAGVSRWPSRGLPRYCDTATPDGEPAGTFILSGAGDFVPTFTPRVRPDPGRWA
jgi:hypothetical protein